MTPAALKRRDLRRRSAEHAREVGPALRDRYGLGPHDLARDPGDLRDLMRAVQIVTGEGPGCVAVAIGCTERNLYRRMK